jgi:general secretion pathway protein G
MNAVRIVRKGFTLVEILIVVIILGILAAIVIPQFTSASEDARQNSLVSQVQTIRSQIELYKLQHTSDASELFGGSVAADHWMEFTSQTDSAGDAWVEGTSEGSKFGPYLQTVPVNGVNGKSEVVVDDTVTEASTAVIDTDAGFVYNNETGKFFALNKDGEVTLDGK